MTEQSEFSYMELMKRVQKYLKERNLKPTGSWPMIGKALLVCGLWGFCYWGLMSYGPKSLLTAVSGTLLLIFFSLAMQLGVMHDASHRSISRSNFVNGLVNCTLTFVGVSSIMWYYKHVVAHHGQTNIPGHDPDIHTGGLFRFYEQDRWRKWHRWQYLYALPLYSMLALRWVWIDDFADTIRNVYPIKKSLYRWLWVELIVSRLCHVMMFMILPYLLTKSILFVAAFYLVHWILFGLCVSVIFQLAHVSDVQAFPPGQLTRKNDWALHQLNTTANFAVNNRFLTWFIGGLNFQIEHHIFPGISHRHYYQIHQIVKEYCREHQVTYNEYRHFFSAFGAHFKHLYRFSRPAALSS